uniref:Uncharacterized protein n=1 Tax=Knipowitschia caucasica TaxID=637954 RepID=A0AAV2MEZ9_KNICA
MRREQINNQNIIASSKAAVVRPPLGVNFYTETYLGWAQSKRDCDHPTPGIYRSAVGERFSTGRSKMK